MVGSDKNAPAVGVHDEFAERQTQADLRRVRLLEGHDFVFVKNTLAMFGRNPRALIGNPESDLPSGRGLIPHKSQRRGGNYDGAS